MYNPEKQARAAGGKFGGKIVTDAEKVAEDVGVLASDLVQEGKQLANEAAVEVEQAYKSINERINAAPPGAIVMVDTPVGDVSWGKIAIAIIAVALLAFVLFG
jgi:ElaB/YqjD/DUF883 family membrane-anchored ribosome-binding protein